MAFLMGKSVPDPQAVVTLVQLLEQQLFPRSSTPPPLDLLRTHLLQILEFVQDYAPFNPQVSADTVLDQLPAIKSAALLDAHMILHGDPAARFLEEVILCYPGFRAVLVYRFSHALLLSGVPIVPRMISECIHTQTGIDIHPGARIQAPFFIDHGTGVVIGETSVIGRNVHLYQGVTLGALAVNKEDADVKRHPTVGDNVVIYANATILGGSTTIGNDCVIGGNSFITHDVPPYSVVYSEHKTVIRDRTRPDQPIDFSI